MFPASSDQLTPYHVDNLSKKKIWDVCAAREGHHCFGIGQNDWCFVWGETKQKGALGLGRGAHSTTPFLVKSLRKQKVKQACCSAIHSLCITEQMVIYGWGAKSLTLLDKNTKEPTPLNFINGKGLKKLAAANTHSLAWNPNNIEVWSFGMAGPWLGYGDDNTDNNQRCGVMKFDDSIMQNEAFSVTFADCSSQYSLVILNTGYVGACGINEHGRMGVGKKVQQSANVIWNAKLQNIVLCSAGSMHSGFVDTEGAVYTCGVGADFRLGHGDKETLWDAKQVESCKDIAVCQIECVDSRTFVITPQGNLVMWGKEPVTGRTHPGPFLYEYLNAYRIYDICGAQDFCVAIGIRAKEPIPKPKIDNISVDSMNPNAQVSDMNRLIGDVIGNYHPLGQQHGFNVDNVIGNFLSVSKTVKDNPQQQQQQQQQGIPGPPMGAPPMNVVYGNPQGGGPPQNVAFGGSQMNMGGGYRQSQYGGSQMNMNNMGGPPPNAVFGGNMGNAPPPPGPPQGQPPQQQQQAQGQYGQQQFGQPQQQQQQQQYGGGQFGGSQMSFNNQYQGQQ